MKINIPVVVRISCSFSKVTRENNGFLKVVHH